VNHWVVGFGLGLGLALVSVSALSAQPAQGTTLTFGARGGLAFPHVALGTDSTYRGDVQETWQAEFGIGIGRRKA
jgi:hypothetical protein